MPGLTSAQAEATNIWVVTLERRAIGIIHDEAMVNDLPGAIVTQPGKPAMHPVPGGRLPGTDRHAMPPRRTWQVASPIARIGQGRVRPQTAPAGRKG